MPSTYTHVRFGNDVLRCLPQKQQQQIEAYRELFDIGLHGPDLLFYYRPLTSDPVNRIGYAMHEQPASSFFIHAGDVWHKSGFQDEYVAYIYGFLCHFALDRECHDYIDEKIAESGAGHAHIEVSFDRSLLVADGYDPVAKKLAEHIHPSKDRAEVISRFYADVTPEEIFRALRSMVFYNRLLCAPGRGKRWIIRTILRLSGHYREMNGLLVDEKPDPVCRDSDEILLKRYQAAIPKAAGLIRDFEESARGNLPYDPLYRYTFSSRLIEKAEEEQHEV